MAEHDTVPDAEVSAVRAFNRFYTRQIGLLNEGLLRSEFSLTETRVLYELAHRDHLTASDLIRDLGLDAGYLSRILKKYERRGYLERSPSADDARQSILELTPAGREAFEPLNEASHTEVAAMLAQLSPDLRGELLASMDTVRNLLGETSEAKVPYIIRPHQPGDIGWIIHRQGLLYHEEYGWDETFEALVAEIAASFVMNFDPKLERCWIAEREGQVAGSVFVVKKTPDTAQLRLLYVDPGARGLGIGRRLVEECIRFARAHGYKTLTLWTNDILVSARRIYESSGFKLVAEEPHHSFGKDLVGQNWDLDL